MNGIVIVDKPQGWTSQDVTARLRRVFSTRRIGHGGTLDPMATGVLPVFVGRATRAVEFFEHAEKTYEATLRLGMKTDTQDITGTVLEERPVTVTEQDILNVLPAFRGEILQIPPMYSALKVNGQKLYDLARKGKEVERQPRPITVHELELLHFDGQDARIRVRCSKGTYIRTLCHDIGQKLGCGGVMTHLLRSRVGEFRAEDAYRLSEIQSFAEAGRLQEILVPTENMFSQFMTLKVKDSGLKALQNGNKLFSSQVVWEKEPTEGQELRVYGKDGQFFGIYRYDAEEKLFCPVKMFFE